MVKQGVNKGWNRENLCLKDDTLINIWTVKKKEKGGAVHAL